jgi:hypothetical protein
MTEQHAVLAKQSLPSILVLWGSGGGFFLELVENINTEVIILSYFSGRLHASLLMALLPERKKKKKNLLMILFQNLIHTLGRRNSI